MLRGLTHKVSGHREDDKVARVQSTSGIPCACAEARTRRANRPAIRIGCVPSNSSSLPPGSRRHQVRNSPGEYPNGK